MTKRFYHCFYSELPDQFVQANVDALKRFAGRWHETRGHVPRFQTIEAVNVHMHGSSKVKWPTLVADSTIQLRRWMEKNGGNYDGRYWESLAQDQRSPDRKPGDAGGDDTVIAYDPYLDAFKSIIPGRGPGSPGARAGVTINTISRSAIANMTANDLAALRKAFALQQHSVILPSQMLLADWYDEVRPALKREGIVAGEIIGYRYWRLQQGYLRSVYQNDVWQPGQVLEGRELGDWDSRGIHAWKSRGSREYLDYLRGYLKRDDEPFVFSRFLNDRVLADTMPAMVTGTVFLWGDVVEHERGWRAEFARVRSLDWLYPDAISMGREQMVLDNLRQIYRVGRAA